jgi:nucleotide-binding universal stress UspA family protein
MRFLVPLDGSPASERALEHALSLAAGNPGALLILLNVQTPEALGLSDIRAKSENDRC